MSLEEESSGGGRRHEPFIPAWLDDSKISSKAFRVLCHLWRRRNRRTGQCNPNVANIAKACRMHRETVTDAIRELADVRLLTRAKHGFRASNDYVLLVPPTGGKTPPIDDPNWRKNPTQLAEKSDTNWRKKSATKVHKEGSQEKESVTSASVHSHFSEPSLSEWTGYAVEIHWRQEDAESAFDHYLAVGWKIGSKPMRDWKAAARNCQRRGNLRAQLPASRAADPVRLGSNLQKFSA